MSDADADAAGADGDPSHDEAGGHTMTFWEHLEELRGRLVRACVAIFVGCVAAWEFHGRILNALEVPFADAWSAAHIPGAPDLHQAAPAAGFAAFMKLSLIGGVALASPVVFYQLWSFVAPGLYAREKKYVLPFVVLSTLLFVGGGWFGWRVALPLSLKFFFGLAHDTSANVSLTPTLMVGEYIDFCLRVMLGFGAAFELPMLLLFLSIAGVVNYVTLLRFGRWFIFLSFVIAAVITPPDALSMLVMAIPLCVLYGLSIGLVYLFGRRPSAAELEAYRASKKADA